MIKTPEISGNTEKGRLVWLAGWVVFAAVVGALTVILAQSPVLVLGVMALALAVALMIVLIRQPFICVLLVLVSSVFSGYGLIVSSSGVHFSMFTFNNPGALTIRPDQLLVPLSVTGIMLNIWRRRQRPVLGRSLPFGLLIGVNIISSRLYSPDFSYSLRMCLFYVIGLGAYLGIINYARTRDDYQKLLRAYLGVGAFQAVLALSPLGGYWVLPDDPLRRLHGSFLEPVLFGNYTLLVSITMLAWLAWRRSRQAMAWWHRPMTGLVIIAGLLSFARATWIGLALGVIALWTLLPGHRHRRRLAIPLAVSGLTLLGLMMVALFNTELLSEWLPAGSPVTIRLLYASVTARMEVIAQALSAIQNSLLLGNGTLTFGVTHGLIWQEWLEGSRGWITSGLLLALHDTGIIGALLYLTGLAFLARDAWRAMRRADPLVAYMATGAWAALLAWFFVEQISPTITTTLPWVFFGMVNAVSRLGVTSDVTPEHANAHGATT